MNPMPEELTNNMLESRNGKRFGDLRESVLSCADAIRGIAHMLEESGRAANMPGEFFEDLGGANKAASELYLYAKRTIRADAFEPEAGGESFEEKLSTVRHDIANRLNHITSPSQFLLMDHGGSAVGDDLRRIIDYCDLCYSMVKSFKGDDVVAHFAPEKNIEPREPVKAIENSPVEPAHVLVADDNPTNREILRRFLERDHHRCTFAEDGQEALERVESEDFDLLLLDIMMPRMDGFGVLEKMRDSAKLRHTPVIVITGLDDVRDAVRCIEMGAEDFLSRPIELSLLKARVDACLERKRLREKVLAQFFTPKLAREIYRQPDLLKIGGKGAEVTILFCDIRSFSSISERIGPDQTIKWLSSVMDTLSQCVMDQEGVLVDYTGDELMAMWGAPSEDPLHAERACKAACTMMQKLAEIDARWMETIGSPTRIGIGLNTGEAFVGNVGTTRKFKYGPLGNTVNLGSRVQGATKYLRSPLLITGATKAKVGDLVQTRRLCTVKVNNIAEPVELHELDLTGEKSWVGLRDEYEKALDFFESQNFRKSSAILSDILLQHPDDGPSLLLMSRSVNALLKAGPDKGHPVWELPGK